MSTVFRTSGGMKFLGDITPDVILATKKGYGATKNLLIGTMSNRGAVNHTLAINGAFSIPEGYHNGLGKVNQALSTKGAATITPSTVDQAIAANQYLTGIQTIKGDADLIGGNILDGKDIFGIVGTVLRDPFTTLSPGTWYDLASISSAQWYTGSTEYIPITQSIKVLRAGTVRVAFELVKSGMYATAVYGRVYKNGVAIGTERSITADGAVTTFTQDFAANVNDVFTIYYKRAAGSAVTAYIQKMWISIANSLPVLAQVV